MVMESAGKWADAGAYDYDKKKVYAGVGWGVSTTTASSTSSGYWCHCPKAESRVTPLAPYLMRNFGYEGF